MDSSPDAGALLLREPRASEISAPHANRGDVHRGAHPRLLWIDASRGLVMLMVILLHISGYEYLPDTAGYSSVAVNSWNEVNNLLAAARMPALFVISGWLASTSISEGFGFSRTRKRILTNAWLLVLWTGIYAAVTVVLKGQNTPNTVTPSTVLVNLLLPNSTLWFLAALVWYTVLLTALRRVPKIVVLAGLLALSAYTITYWSTVSGLWVKLPQFGLFFALGVYGKAVFSAVARHAVLAMPIGLACAVLGIHWQSYQSEHQEWGYPSFLLIAISLPIFLYALCSIATSMAPRLCSPLTAIGRNTVALYVLHFPVLLALIHIGPVHQLLLVVLRHELGRWLWPLVYTLAFTVFALAVKKRLDDSRFAWLLGLPRGLTRWIDAPTVAPEPERIRVPAVPAQPRFPVTASRSRPRREDLELVS